jgi:hypothetical protein
MPRSPRSQRPRNVKAIVNQQVQLWRVERKEYDKKQRRKAADEPWPIICISREFGSLGAEVALQVSKKCGFTFWDQELVAAIAERTGARKALVESLDENVRGGLDEWLAGLITGPSGTAAEYVRQLGLVIHTLEEHGGAVVVGRGGQFIATPERALRVRVVSPYEKRVAGYGERQEIGPAEARAEVTRMDRVRLSFYRKHWSKDVTRPMNYDLVVNIGSMSLRAACDTITAAYRAKFRRSPKPS